MAATSQAAMLAGVWRRTLIGATVGLAGLLAAAAAQEAPAVDLELVLAVDTSGSVDAYEFHLQIQGIAAAFRDPEVHEALAAAGDQGAAVALVQWSGRRQQAVVVDWMRVSDARSARAFAARVEASTRWLLGETAIADALEFAYELLERNRFQGFRRVIDVSGDGPTNAGRDPDVTRDAAIAGGVTINGLVITNELEHLDVYYREHVIGGADAFLMRVTDYEDFAEALRLKLIKEIRGAPVS